MIQFGMFRSLLTGRHVGWQRWCVSVNHGVIHTQHSFNTTLPLVSRLLDVPSPGGSCPPAADWPEDSSHDSSVAFRNGSARRTKPNGLTHDRRPLRQAVVALLATAIPEVTSCVNETPRIVVQQRSDQHEIRTTTHVKKVYFFKRSKVAKLV